MMNGQKCQRKERFYECYEEMIFGSIVKYREGESPKKHSPETTHAGVSKTLGSSPNASG